MSKRFLLLAAVLLFSCTGKQEKGILRNQGNPLFRDAFTANPAPLAASDGRLYVFCSHDEQYDDQPGFKGKEGYNCTEWLCYSTADMQTWTAHGAVLRPADFSWAEAEAWSAQCVEAADGKYYLYVTLQNEEPDCKAIGVAVADNPTGPYRDALGKPLILDDMTQNGPLGAWNDIDPTVMVDDDGTPWLCWGNGTCFLARLKKNMVELDGPIQTLPLDNFAEGPWLYKRNGLYYLAYASMGHGRETLSYAMATHIQGPWESKGEFSGMAEDSFSIHPGIVDFNGNSYLFYHNGILTLNGYGPATGRRSISVEYLIYNTNGTLKPVQQTRLGVSR